MCRSILRAQVLSVQMQVSGCSGHLLLPGCITNARFFCNLIMPDAQPSSRSTAELNPSSSDEAALITLSLDRLKSESVKNQLQLIEELAGSDVGLAVLQRFLIERQTPAGLAEGKAYQALFQNPDPNRQAFLNTHFPQGIVPLQSERNVDYVPLQQLLAQQSFQAADRLTLEKLCELAGTQSVQRKWLYFTEVEKFPVIDLQTINQLWLVHSEGRFGFSVQRELWLSVGKNWEKLWYQIGWKSGNNWTRYPQEFTWSLAAPRGHLPLSNQLRGVRVIAALLNHPAWQ
jgi:GUN4-like/ARM-like repeat domain, GUN4-N terminal